MPVYQAFAQHAPLRRCSLSKPNPFGWQTLRSLPHYCVRCALFEAYLAQFPAFLRKDPLVRARPCAVCLFFEQGIPASRRGGFFQGAGGWRLSNFSPPALQGANRLCCGTRSFSRFAPNLLRQSSHSIDQRFFPFRAAGVFSRHGQPRSAISS